MPNTNRFLLKTTAEAGRRAFQGFFALIKISESLFFRSLQESNVDKTIEYIENDLHMYTLYATCGTT